MDPVLPTAAEFQSLRDIQEMTPPSWWPPAPGWWLAGLILAALLFLVWRWRGLLGRRSRWSGMVFGGWRRGARLALRDLERRVAAGQAPKVTAGELSELLRRIAMAHQGRHACAGLTGTAWLDWLAAHDPNGYPWDERARVLIVAPYAPKSRGGEGLLPELIEAADAWVMAADPGWSGRRLLARAPSLHPSPAREEGASLVRSATADGGGADV